MATHLVNVAPVPESTGMLVDDYYRVALRDDVTRVDKSSLLAQVAYSKASYEGGPDLPEVLGALVGGSSFVAAFSDAGATSVPSSDVVGRVPGPPMVMTRILGGAHRGAQFLESVPVASPYVFEADVLPTAWTLGAASYLNDVRYIGVCFGFIFGPDKTGIFGFLLDDGGVKKVMLSGADDGTGARPGSVEIVHDWSLGYVYKFVWDPARDLVDVYARLSSDVDALATLLHSFTLSALPPFVANVAFGSTPISPTSADVPTIMGFLNLDSPTIADSVSSEFLRLFEFGRNLIVGGVTQGGVNEILSATDIILADMRVPAAKAMTPWEHSTPTGAITGGSSGTVISKVKGTDDGSLRVLMRRDEPAFSIADGVMLYAQFQAVTEEHFGTIGTGMGFAFDDGVGRLLLMLLDDFADKRVGVFQVGSNIALSSYQAALALDWETSSVSIKMFVNGARGTITVYVMGDDDTPILEASTATLAASLGAPVVEAGHVDIYSARPVFGSLTLTEMQYGLDVVEYDTSEGVVPAAATPPWTETVSGAGAGSSVMAAGLFVLTDNDYGLGALQGRRLERRTIPAFGTLIGATVEGRFQITAWSNQAGNQEPLEPINAGLAIDDGTVVVHLAFVETLYGKFVYLPQKDAAQTLTDVILQNAAGRTLSASVDFTALHTYRLEKKPGLHIKLYIDDSFTPAITLAWDNDLGFDMQPTFGLGVGVLFGSFDPSRKSTSKWKRTVFSAGNGYDLAVRPALTIEERNNAFDATSELILQVTGI